MAVIDSPVSAPPKTTFYNDPVIRGYIYQFLVAVGVICFFIWIGINTAQNLAAQNKSTGFDFLWRTAGFSVSFSLIPFDRASYYWEAFVVGLLNTLLVAAIGIFFATIIGFTVGIARLSSNWLVSRIATVYVEIIRNIPLLLQLFFWYFAVLKAMPAVRESLALPFGSYLNQRGFFVPQPIFDDRAGWMWIGLALAIAFGIGLKIWARRRLERTGQRFPVFITTIAAGVLILALTYIVSGTVITFSYPELQRFNFRGGLELPPEFVALAFGLSIYTAAFIAETVRAGIRSVNRGQTEAAQSLGLREGDRLRLVIIPQAMRVIIPPLTSQYLNLTKNSSLGAAIGYPELVNVFAGTTLNQTGKAIEVIGMTMLVYLTFSLLTSAFMNWYNGRVALVER
ncbi:amino acid ABC transporter permease [Devosia sp.]|uniref:amino acid ABC transporter permease n=1 Tax=Devosia sp. TaxID=1871048 RepID=UPI002B00113A|nr:amino acid ABC transporter permease [Devosia sp.]